MTNFKLSTVRETVSIFDQSGYPLGEATWLTSTNTVEVHMFDWASPISIDFKSSLVETVNEFLNSRMEDK
jgi:hypothetical protein